MNNEPTVPIPASVSEEASPLAAKEFKIPITMDVRDNDPWNQKPKSLWSAHQGFAHAVRYLEDPKPYGAIRADLYKYPNVIRLSITRHVTVRTRGRRHRVYSSRFRMLTRVSESFIYKSQLLDPYIWNLETPAELVREIHDDLRARPKGYKREDKRVASKNINTTKEII